jgi:hypothetical protein
VIAEAGPKPRSIILRFHGAKDRQLVGGGLCQSVPTRPRGGSETKRVDDFAAMSDEELRAYVYGTKEQKGE